MSTLQTIVLSLLTATTLILSGCGLDIGDSDRRGYDYDADAGQDDARPRRDVGPSEPGHDTGYADSAGGDAGYADSGARVDGGSIEPSGSNSPRILTLSTNTSRLLPGQTLIVSAVVTDPDGINDLIGGVLTDPESGGTYGAFATAESEGAYSIHITWWDLHQVRAIESGMGGTTRSFRVEFFDVAGHTAAGQLSVALTCENADEALCSGYCKDLLNDVENCGGCGNDVSAVADQGCIDGVGYDIATSATRSSCQTVCAERGMFCTPNLRADEWLEEQGVAPDEIPEGDLEAGAVYFCGAGAAQAYMLLTCGDVPPETVVEGGVESVFGMIICSCSTAAP